MLFQKAETKAKRLKLYLFGPSGVGKTVFSLHFPNPAVIDAERGTDFYGDKFDFFRIQTTDPTVVEDAIRQLSENPGDFKTLIIDPFTTIAEEISLRHLKRMRIKKNNPLYDLQPLDYKVIKNELKLLINNLLALDLNVIITARSKKQYAEGEFMRVVGQQPDGPDSLPYLFDVVMEAYLGEDGERKARVLKDRTNTLPPEFDLNYEVLTTFFGIEDLQREAVKFNTQKNMSEITGRRFETIFDGNKVMTAGITGDQLEVIKQRASSSADAENKLNQMLRDEFAVDSFLDLRKDEADYFLITTKDLNL